MISRYARHATGGGIAVLAGAQATVACAQLSSNDAGGVGRYESNGGFAADVARQLQLRAQHFYVAGSVHVENCTLLSARSETPNAAPWQMVGMATGEVGSRTDSQIVVTDSFLRGSAPGQGLLTLHSGAQALVRGCDVKDLEFGPITNSSVLGIVNSTLTPPLGGALQNAMTTRLSMPPLLCAAQIAGERVCDQRARCDAVASGGVQCSCVDEGVRPKEGTSNNGRQCEQDMSIRGTLESDSVSVTIAKPGSLNRTLKLIVEARGEAGLNVTYHVTMTLRKASSGAVIAANASIRFDQPSISAFGLHLEWTQRPPAVTWNTDLDGSKLKFADTSRHEFAVRLSCDRDEQSCASDGDVITTAMQFTSPQDGRLRSEVTVQTRVEALVSCNTSAAFVTSAGLMLEGESIAAESPVEVRILARDIDNSEVPFTRAAIELLWEDASHRGEKVLLNAKSGTSEYTAMLGSTWTREPGRYTLSVRVVHSTGGSCEVLRRSIMVTADKTQLIVGLVLIGAVLAVVFLGSWFLYKNRESAKKFVLSFLSFEGTLAADICIGVWGIAGGGFFFFEVRKQSSKPWVSRLIVPYMVFFALACAVSLAIVIVKSRLLALKLKSRHTAARRTKAIRRISIGGVAISPGLSGSLADADLSSVADLKSKFDEHRQQRQLAYCHMATALLEDLPLGAPLPKRHVMSDRVVGQQVALAVAAVCTQAS
jgi:hypothetical protein